MALSTALPASELTLLVSRGDLDGLVWGEAVGVVLFAERLRDSNVVLSSDGVRRNCLSGADGDNSPPGLGAGIPLGHADGSWRMRLLSSDGGLLVERLPGVEP
jgi:hypothetical protein